MTPIILDLFYTHKTTAFDTDDSVSLTATEKKKPPGELGFWQRSRRVIFIPSIGMIDFREGDVSRGIRCSYGVGKMKYVLWSTQNPLPNPHWETLHLSFSLTVHLPHSRVPRPPSPLTFYLFIGLNVDPKSTKLLHHLLIFLILATTTILWLIKIMEKNLSLPLFKHRTSSSSSVSLPSCSCYYYSTMANKNDREEPIPPFCFCFRTSPGLSSNPNQFIRVVETDY